MAVTVNSIMRSVRLQLGQDGNYGVSVEASDAQIVHAIRLALQEYSRHFPIRSYQSFIAPPGMYVYKPDPPIRGVIEVNMLQDTEAVIASPEVALLGGRISTLGASFQFNSPYAWQIYKVWKEMTDTVMSAKPNWQFVPEDGNLYIYMPIMTHKVSFIGVIDFDVAFEEETAQEPSQDPNDDTPGTVTPGRLDLALKGIPERHASLVIGLARAKVKEITGYMRRKYSSIPGSDREIQLDGQLLAQEGQQEWKDIVTDMRKRMPAMVPSLW